jgi:glycosyltransferase involved in cell wall biosynthesis
VIYGGAKSNWTEREVVDPCLKGKYFLAVGSLIDVKGMDILIRAMARLGDKYNEYNLRIVGNGELRGHLEKTVVELGLKERVVFSGELNHQSLIKLYEESLFCVIPSRSEGLSLVALESQAACKAVIASKVGGLPELIKDNVNGLLFEVGNEEQLSQRISYLIDNPDLAAAMGREGRSQVSKDFNWERNTEEYCNLFDELIGQ